MNRDEIILLVESEFLDTFAKMFGTSKEDLKIFPGYEGAANLVFEYDQDGIPMILRISFNQERTLEQIQAELDFIQYLVDQGVRASLPVTSKAGNLVESINVNGLPLIAVSFIKGKGMRVPDNQYRYRENIPMEEYFYNWGKMLGKMHAATKKYRPINDLIKRTDWFDLHKNRINVETHFPERFSVVRKQIYSLFREIKSLPKDQEGYGLIHGDFNDGNFTVDYSNGNMTVFDFDDCSYFWFVYELASAWEGGIGRVMYRNLEKRKAFMDHYMGTVMRGYDQENSISEIWMEKLPMFIRLIQVEELLHFIQYIEEPDEEIQGQIQYKLFCIEHEIPYMGFFDSIYNPDKPFSL